MTAPLDPNISEKDAAAALAQFEARHVVLFEGVQCAGLAAAARASPGVRVHSAALLGAASPGIFRFTGDCGAIPEADGGPAGLQPCSPIIGFYNRPDDVALLLRTSGTTSMPKVVPLRQGALCVNSLLLGGTLGLTSDDVCLNVMPLFHIGGLSASIIGSMAVGAQVTCMSAFDPAHFFSALSGQAYGGDGNEALGPQPTWYSAVPTIHVAVLNHLQTSANDGTDLGKARSPCRAGFHKLRFIRSGAAALSPQDARNVSDTFGGIPVWSTYSMSEQMPISQPPAFIDPDVHMIEKEGSVGVPVAASLAVVDEKTFVPQPFGRPGVIAISGPTVMQNYLHNPTADASSYFILSCATAGADETSQQLECNSEWRQERFFLTGDVGELDEEGHLVIKGRSKEMIKRGGEQVSPYEVVSVDFLHTRAVRKSFINRCAVAHS
jgi:acyl-CoA synthetase (AMP-forming)/AMP-acid ligase II